MYSFSAPNFLKLQQNYTFCLNKFFLNEIHSFLNMPPSHPKTFCGPCVVSIAVNFKALTLQLVFEI